MEDIVTSDLSRFGFRELDMVADLLKEYAKHGMSDVLGDNVTINMNTSSGNVFLSDEDYNVVLLNDEGKLEQFDTCSYCENEGFVSEIKLDDRGYCEDCKDKK